jgi:anti-anti-sigma factor
MSASLPEDQHQSLLRPGRHHDAQVDAEVVYGILVAALPEEVDLANINEVRTGVLRGLHSTTGGVVINLSKTAYMDATGIRLLIDLHNGLAKDRRPLRLVVRPHSLIVRLLKITNVPIPHDGTLEDALREVKTALLTEYLHALRGGVA